MTACLRMTAGVAVGRTVATQRCAAGLAGAQMNPLVAGLDTFLAHMAFRVLDGRNRFEMFAG